MADLEMMRTDLKGGRSRSRYASWIENVARTCVDSWIVYSITGGILIPWGLTYDLGHRIP